MAAEWIEIPRKGYGRAAVRPDAVMVQMLGGYEKSRVSAYLKLLIGGEIVRKLGWGVPDIKLRMRWMPDGSRCKLDMAPPKHADTYALKPNKRLSVFVVTTSGLPEPILRQPLERAATNFEVLADKVRDRSLSELIIDMPVALLAGKTPVPRKSAAA